MKPLHNKTLGILLIIGLILLVILEGIGLATMSTVVTHSKAVQYTNYQIEAQQKADSIANYAYATLETKRQQMYSTAKTSGKGSDDLIPGTIPTLSSPPVMPAGMNVSSTINNTIAKQWWKTNAQQYPNADALFNLPTGTYATQAGANATDTIAAYIIYQVSFTTDAADAGYKIRTFKIVAYATDSTGTTAATREKYYVWTDNCKQVQNIPAPDANGVYTYPGTGCIDNWYIGGSDCVINGTSCNIKNGCTRTAAIKNCLNLSACSEYEFNNLISISATSGKDSFGYDTYNLYCCTSTELGGTTTTSCRTYK